MSVCPRARQLIWRRESTRVRVDVHPYFCPYFSPDEAAFAPLDGRVKRQNTRSQACATRIGRSNPSYTIFEGTSEIQRLVIARALTGLRVE